MQMDKKLDILKIGRYFAVLCVMFILVIAQGCETDPPPEENSYQKINDWIFEHMEIFYLWIFTRKWGSFFLTELTHLIIRNCHIIMKMFIYI